MQVLVKPVVVSTELERLYVALECEEFSCECNGECRARRRFLSDEDTDDILF